MIKIEKRIVEVDKGTFTKELQELADIYKKTNRIGFDLKTINKEFKCKLTLGDFVRLCNQLELPLYRGQVILFKSLNSPL